MAGFIVSAKSGSKWTENELRAFNIIIVDQNCAEFFGVTQLPDPKVPSSILENNTSVTNDVLISNFIFFMKKAMSRKKAAVDAFSQEVFHLMDYVPVGYYVTFSEDLTFTMCGEECRAQADVCVMNDDSILLVVKDIKMGSEMPPEGQLIADAIAAYSQNNKRRISNNQAPIAAWTMPGIIMQGPLAMFYKINITQDLVHSVIIGQHPNFVTEVCRYTPMLPEGPNLGMWSLPNRRSILQCFEAFRAFVIAPPPPV
jgi:hypothetical protein